VDKVEKSSQSRHRIVTKSPPFGKVTTLLVGRVALVLNKRKEDMVINICEELASNDMYREAFMKPRKPGIPNEVRLWPDFLQELFCILSDQHLAAGFELQEADRVAIGQVKESARYQEWQKTAEITVRS
jgi:hypothetical protein